MFIRRQHGSTVARLVRFYRTGNARTGQRRSEVWRCDTTWLLGNRFSRWKFW
jgi:hypothetical protein